MAKTEQTVSGEAPRAVEDWLFSILRFAITLDEVDRVATLAAAAAMDRRSAGFTFFARTSIAVCGAIVAKDRVGAISALRVFIGAIDSVLLRRAFEAVFEINPPGSDRRIVSTRNRERLWQGLPIGGLRTASRP
jgi:hypothetical protein